jgi:hypothetical protein
MTLQVTDKLGVTPPVQYLVYKLGVLNSSGYGYPTPGWHPVGTYKSIDSVRTGVFTRDVFRANPVTIRSAEGKSVPGNIGGTWPSDYRYYNEVIGHFLGYASRTPNPPYPLFDVKAKDRALIKTHAKVNDVIWDFGTFLGEIGETIHMLRNPFKNLSTWVSREQKIARLARYNPKGLNYLKDATPFAYFIADNWLQYRYGIMPLIYDCVSAIKAITAVFDKQSLAMHKKGSREKLISSTTSNIGRWGIANITCEISESTKLTTETSCGIYYHQKYLEQSQKLAAILGDVYDIPSIAWELMKFSFVFDWFVNVGSWLKAIKPNPRIIIDGGYVSEVLDTLTKRTVLRPLIFSGPAMINVRPEYLWHTRTLIRQTNLTLPITPAVSPNPLNLKRELDSVALLWRPIEQAFIKSNRR